MKLFLIITILLACCQPGKSQNILDSAKKAYVQGRPYVRFSAAELEDGKLTVFPDAVSDQTIYEIASVTKTFFSLILAHAVLEKKVSLTADIRTYLPGRFPNLAYKDHPVELIHLVNLTSSLPDNFPAGSDFMEQLHLAKLDTVPGLVPRHSNVAAALLGKILENIYHVSDSALLVTYITGPLKMKHTGFSIPPADSMLLAKGYDGNGRQAPYIPFSAGASGGLHSTIGDMAAYVKLHLDETDSAVRMTHQLWWGDQHDFALGMNWFLGQTGDGLRTLSDDGNTYGFASYIQLYPEKHFAVLMLVNERDSSGNNRLGSMAADIFSRTFYSAEQRGSDGFGFSSSINKLLAALNKSGFDQAIPAYRKLKANDAGFSLRENEVNNWGYSLSGKNKKKEALEIFRLNVYLFPDSWNVYDSYGEMLLARGGKEEARRMYQKSVELNPGSENGKKVLKSLE